MPPPPPRRVRVVNDNAETVYDHPLPYYKDVYPARSNEKEEEIGRAYDWCDEESSDDDLDSNGGKRMKMQGGTVQHVSFFSPVGLGEKQQAGQRVNVNVKEKGRKERGTNIFAEFAAPKTNNQNPATSGLPSLRKINEPNAKRKLLTPRKFGMFASPPASSPPPQMSSPGMPEMNTAAEVLDDLLSGRPSVDAEEMAGEGANVDLEESGDQTATTQNKRGQDHTMVDTPVQDEGEKAAAATASDADAEDNGAKAPMKSTAGKKRKRDMQTVDASKIKSHRTRGQERREMEKVEAEKKAAKSVKRAKTAAVKTSSTMGRSKCGKAGGRSGKRRAIVEVYDDETDSEQYVRWE